MFKQVKNGIGILGLMAVSAFAKEELNLYIWSEYIDPDIVTQFEEKFDCKMNVSLFESNEEMLAKLQAGGVSQYDLVIAADYIVPALKALKLIQPITKTEVPNIKNLKDNFISPPFDVGNEYSVGWQWGTLGIMYDSTTVSEPVDSWGAIFDAPKGVRFDLFDSEREMIGAALLYQGDSINTRDKAALQKVAKRMIASKKRKEFSGFDANVAGFGKLMGGVLDITIGYNGDGIRAMAENDKFKFVIPKEGSVIWMDSLCIPAKAPNPALAMKFMNYILEPKVGAQLSNYIQFATPNKASIPFIDPECLANPVIYPTPEVEAKLEYIEDLGNFSKVYGELWKMIKTR